MPRRWFGRSWKGRVFELFDVAFGGSGGTRILRVTVDRDGGLDLDTIASLSDKIARRLDLEGFGDGRYELEVSSPGIERPLRTPAHYARAIGARVKVKTDEPIDDAQVHEGVLLAADEARHRARRRRRHRGRSRSPRSRRRAPSPTGAPS